MSEATYYLLAALLDEPLHGDRIDKHAAMSAGAVELYDWNA